MENAGKSVNCKKGTSNKARQMWVWILTLTLTSWVILGKFFSSLRLYFLICEMGIIVIPSSRGCVKVHWHIAHKVLLGTVVGTYHSRFIDKEKRETVTPLNSHSIPVVKLWFEPKSACFKSSHSFYLFLPSSIYGVVIMIILIVTGLTYSMIPSAYTKEVLSNFCWMKKRGTSVSSLPGRL